MIKYIKACIDLFLFRPLLLRVIIYNRDIQRKGHKVITVLHLNRQKLSAETIFELVYRASIDTAIKLYADGQYQAVARVETNQLFDALMLTRHVKKNCVKNWANGDLIDWVAKGTQRSSAFGDIFCSPMFGAMLYLKNGFYHIDLAEIGADKPTYAAI